MKNKKNRLALLAAICSSVFLLAACEPGTEPMDTTTGTDESAPTYGEPDRGTPPSEPQDPAATPGQSEPPASSSQPSDPASQPPGALPGEEPSPSEQPN